jgi:ABC-type nitrate/sulfonate/bicarbonate transport system substrate-binding protein
MRMNGRRASVLRAITLGCPLLSLSIVGPMSASAANLSRSDITLSYTAGVATNFISWLAVKNGFFEREGLTVTLVNVTTSAPDMISATIAGSALVGCGVGAPPLVAAVENGAPLKMIFTMVRGNDYQIVINRKVAEAKGIPPKGAADQIAKLKGSGIKFVMSTAGSSNYLFLASGMKRAGVDLKRDIQLSFAGSNSAIFAAFMSGQGEAFASTSPPIYRVKDDDVVRIDYVDAFPTQAKMDFTYCYTTDEFIKTHSDTLLAFSKAMLKTREYMLHQHDKAKKDLAGFWNEARVTEPDIQDRATNDMLQRFMNSGTPAMLKPMVDATISEVNFQRVNAEDPPKPTTSKVTYETFTDNRHIAAAIKELKLDLPTE